ncbi:MAG: HAD family hydrolase [Rikenellaceae bacterium]|nr:HAD family hydrolase [Rikenellaceae bacterium]
MKKRFDNIVFDLGRVVFAQNLMKHSDEYREFFSYVAQSPMPQFWVDYDLGFSSWEKVVSDLAAYRSVSEEYASDMLTLSIGRQRTIPQTAALIADLKAAGYKLYVLSNMSKEFIEYLRRQEVYAAFDGEVISCEEGFVKPMPEIYDVLIGRFSLDASRTMFIDDRAENVYMGEQKGITGFHFNRDDYDKSCAELREILL